MLVAKVRQPYDEPVIVPALDDQVVNPGQLVTIPDGQLPNFLAAGWKPGDADTKKAAEKLAGEPAQEPAAAGTQEG
jgi:hypothetical protein